MCKYLKLSFLLFSLTTSFNGHAQSGTPLNNWQQMNGTYTAMCKVPNQPSTVYIGDNSGLIRKSTDKGTTWKRAYRTRMPITDVCFLNERTGFAVTYTNGQIISTNDGGNSWSQKQIYDAAEPSNTMKFSSFKKIIAIDSQTAIFEIGGGSASGLNENISTRDGGKTYNIETLPNNLFHVGGDTLIAFGYELDKFNLSKLIISKSFDKGKTWIKAPSFPIGVTTALNVYGVGYAYFININEFYFTANSNSSDKTLYKSMDGGATITTANLPGDKKTKVLWMDFKDSQNGIMVTNAATFPFQRTSDGGATWTGIEGVNPMLPIVKIEGDELLASNTNRCVRTTNYGANWLNLSENIYQVPITNVIPSRAFLNTVTHNTFYASVSAVWGGSFYGTTLVRTNDEGLTWFNVTDNANVKYGGESFHFTTPDTMLFIQNYAISKSTDGGKTSKVIAPNVYFNGSGNAIPRFSFIKGSKTYGVAYAILGASEFWLTKDGGSTWLKTMGTTPNLNVLKLQIIADDAWYMLASENNKAAVYKSTDEGKNWNNITGTILLNTSAEVFDAAGMCFANKTTGYVFGPKAALYKTIDGGTTWASIREDLPQTVLYYNFTNMAFRTEYEGYLHPGMQVKNNTWAMGTSGLKMEFSNDTTLGAMMDNYGNFYKYFVSSTITDEKVIASKLTGIDQARGESALITVFPNPTHDELHIDAKGKSLTIAIIDLLGKTHLMEIIRDHSVISVKDLPNGIYFIKTSNPNEHQLLKFLKY